MKSMDFSILFSRVDIFHESFFLSKINLEMNLEFSHQKNARFREFTLEGSNIFILKPSLVNNQRRELKNLGNNQLHCYLCDYSVCVKAGSRDEFFI